MEELNLKPIKVIYKVFCNNTFAYVLNREPHFLYTKLDKDTIIGEDEAMYPFYMRDEGPYKYMAFGGRHFQIPLTDGTVEECHGQWWDGMSDTARKLYNPDNLRYFAYSTIEELRKCYVYTGCYADFEWIRKLDMEYDGEIYDYWKFEEMIKNKMTTNKPILDACCGGRMFYFDKHDPRVLFQDIRDVETTLCDGWHFEIKPDIQADFTNMPYEDGSFSMVVFDPPHLLRNVGNSKMADMYGSLNPKAKPTGSQNANYGTLYSDWREMLTKGFAECFRVLKPGGFLIFKWNETDIKVSEILKLTPEKPIFGHKSGKRANTHWICFMKDDKHL